MLLDEVFILKYLSEGGPATTTVMVSVVFVTFSANSMKEKLP